MQNLSSTLARDAAFEEMVRKFNVLRDQFASALLKRDFLLKTLKPNLESLYYLEIGVKEYELLKIRLEASSCKRKIELIQSRLNRGESADIAEIDKIIKQEFVQWQIDINLLSQTIDDSKKRLGSLMSEADSKEIRHLYRELAKRLHPDLNANFSRRDRTLWNQTQKAYEDSNLLELRLLYTLINNKDFVIEEKSERTSLEERIVNIQNLLLELLKEINSIKSVHPFTIEDNLQKPEWVNAKKSEYDTIIEGYKPYLENLEFHLVNLMLVVKNGQLSTN
jgi:hypothetical protein